MDEISNKTLATLLVVAIVISLAGTFFAMRGVSTITNVITGAAEYTTGESKVNITSRLDIVLDSGFETVDLGDGYLNNTGAGEDDCWLSSNQSGSQPNSTCWHADSFSPTPFKLENDGNRWAIVKINSTDGATLFSNGYQSGDRDHMYRAYGADAATASVCTVSPVTDWTSFSGTSTADNLCGNMSYNPSNNQLWVDIGMMIPTLSSGEYSASVGFVATDAGQ